MDGLSVAASVIAVIQISSEVFQACQKYAKAVKNARQDIIRLRNEVLNLQDVLDYIEEKANSPDVDDLSVVRLLLRDDGPMIQCKIQLQNVLDKLEHSGDKAEMWKSTTRRLKWPFTSKDISQILEGLERNRMVLQLALIAEQSTLLRSFGKGLNEIKEIVSQTESETKAINVRLGQAEEKQEIKDFLEWLSSPDYTRPHQEALRKYHSSTGKWFLESEAFSSWKEKAGGTLWLHGLAGGGKTILSSAIIESTRIQYEHVLDAVCAFFYFEFSSIEMQDPRSLLASVIAQISLKSKVLKDFVLKLKRERIDPNPKVKSGFLSLLTILCEICKYEKAPKIYMIVDAMDECPHGQYRANLIYLLSQISGWQSPKLHLLATSRSEPDIEREFKTMKDISIIPLQTNEVDEDIRSYLRYCLENDKDLRDFSPRVKANILEVLGSGANGMFRWVYCHLEIIREQVTAKDVSKALKTLPKTLEKTYDRMIANIKEQHQDYARRALTWIAFSKRQLAMHEIAEATVFDPNEEFDVDDRLKKPSALLQILGSLITVLPSPISKDSPEMIIDDEEDHVDTVQLAHYTVKEYLQRQRIQQGSLRTFSLGPEFATIFLATACIKYLLFAASDMEDRFSNEPNDGADGTSGASMNLAAFFRLYPLIGYALKTYNEHAKDTPSQFSEELDTLLTRLLSSRTIMSLHYSSDATIMKLIYATQQGHIRQVQDIVKTGVNVNEVPLMEDPDGMKPYAPLYHAVMRGFYEIAEILLENGADPNSPFDPTEPQSSVLCSIADELDKLPFIRLLLKYKADPNFGRTGDGMSALHLAVQCGELEIVQLLLEHGADVNVTNVDDDNSEDIWYWRPIHSTEEEGREDIRDLLLKYGAEDVPAQPPEVTERKTKEYFLSRGINLDDYAGFDEGE